MDVCTARGPQGVDYRLNEERHGPRLTGHVPDSERPQEARLLRGDPGEACCFEGLPRRRVWDLLSRLVGALRREA